MMAYDLLRFSLVLMGLHEHEYPHNRYLYLGFIAIVIDVTFLSCAYFLSCTPKPPTKSKFTQLLEKLGRTLHQEPEPSGI